jgi:hypothetical protein
MARPQGLCKLRKPQCVKWHDKRLIYTKLEPCMARKFLIVAPAYYPISYCPRKRALRITTSSDGGASTSTGSCSGTTDSGTSSSCCWLELAAFHMWHSVRGLAHFRSPPPPLLISSIFIHLRHFIICKLLFLLFIFQYIYTYTYVYICLFIPQQLFILLL